MYSNLIQPNEQPKNTPIELNLKKLLPSLTSWEDLLLDDIDADYLCENGLPILSFIHLKPKVLRLKELFALLKVTKKHLITKNLKNLFFDVFKVSHHFGFSCKSRSEGKLIDCINNALLFSHKVNKGNPNLREEDIIITFDNLLNIRWTVYELFELDIDCSYLYDIGMTNKNKLFDLLGTHKSLDKETISRLLNIQIDNFL